MKAARAHPAASFAVSLAPLATLRHGAEWCYLLHPTLTALCSSCCQSDNTTRTPPATSGYVGLHQTPLHPPSRYKMRQNATETQRAVLPPSHHRRPEKAKFQNELPPPPPRHHPSVTCSSLLPTKTNDSPNLVTRAGQTPALSHSLPGLSHLSLAPLPKIRDIARPFRLLRPLVPRVAAPLPRKDPPR